MWLYYLRFLLRTGSTFYITFWPTGRTPYFFNGKDRDTRQKRRLNMPNLPLDYNLFLPTSLTLRIISIAISKYSNVWYQIEGLDEYFTNKWLKWVSLACSSSLIWRLSGFSLFWYLPLVGGNYESKENPLKRQRRLGLTHLQSWSHP